MGAINWAGVVPRAEDSGVRLDRCGFGWGLRASLHNYGTSFGARGSAGYIEACDLRGAALPLPYATGAGYIFSAALLRWVATDPKVVGWVAEAAGPEREALQWQKFEDTTTGYWLTHSPEPVEYVNIGYWHHDYLCGENGEVAATRGGIYRPPANYSILVHNLKRGGFRFAHARMEVARGSKCMRGIGSEGGRRR